MKKNHADIYIFSIVEPNIFHVNLFTTVQFAPNLLEYFNKLRYTRFSRHKSVMTRVHLLEYMIFDIKTKGLLNGFPCRIA